tara:strand:- start:767 stop:970 length:204 start_codon:yes stop_codon:yes gene_type:complete
MCLGKKSTGPSAEQMYQAQKVSYSLPSLSMEGGDPDRSPVLKDVTTPDAGRVGVQRRTFFTPYGAES